MPKIFSSQTSNDCFKFEMLIVVDILT